MKESIKRTCSNCDHSLVCKYKDTYHKFENAYQKLFEDFTFGEDIEYLISKDTPKCKLHKNDNVGLIR